MDFIAIVLGILALIALIGLGFGLFGIVYNAAYGYPMFVIGIVFFVLLALFAAIMGRK